MKTPGLQVGVVLLFLSLAGCQKKEVATPVVSQSVTLEMVKESERSRHFLAVSKELELGGTLYGYADIDGDALKLATGLQGLMEEMAKTQPQAASYLKQDYAALFKILGLTDIKALGVSSVPDGTGYFRNRVFFYTPEQRHGLLAGLGGEPAPLARLSLAPADADVYSEGEIDLPAVYKTITEVVAKAGGAESVNKMEAGLKSVGQNAAISLLSVLQNWKGRIAVVMRIEEGPGFRLPGPTGVQFPAFSLLLSIDGIAPALRDTLVKQPLFSSRHEGTREFFELKQPLPVPGLSPVIVIDGSTLMVVTSTKFLNECLQANGALGRTPDFQKALAPFGPNSNGIGYISPRFFAKLHGMEALNSGLPPEMQHVLQTVLNQLPRPDRPLVTVRTNLPDGILIRSYWNRSLKQDVATIAIYNPVTIGILAAMAIPAFEKVRTASQEKAVMNNLRQLSAAADQYYLENGVSTTTYSNLVGPDKYVRKIMSVGGETYTSILFKQGLPLRVMVPSLKKVVEYAP